jgi:two-component sensor histidine kinase
LDLLPADFICTIAENEAVPLALVMNELILNAVKHTGQSEQVNVILKANLSNNTIKLLINNKGQLPPGFDFNSRCYFNTGLDLVASLLPPTGVKLSFEQQGSTVVTLLECQHPVINLKVQSSILHEN